MNKLFFQTRDGRFLRFFFTRSLFLVLLFAVVPGKILASPNYPFPNSRYITIDGLKLHYRLWESSNDELRGNVIMVHGFGGSTYSWEEVADSLSQLGYRALAVDVPPFGYSDRAPRQNQSVTYRAALLNAFLNQQFPGEKWHLAGHSMGGAIVQAMALLYPENYQSINFVGAALFSSINPQERKLPLVFRIPGSTAFIGNIAESWIIKPGRVEGLIESAYGQKPAPSQVRAYMEPLSIPGTARAILNSARYSDEIHQLEASDLSIPAIAIWGADDSWVSYESRRTVVEQIKGMELIIIEGSGHNPMETHFNEFIDIYITFLNNL
ncbi:MAG: alpha/beta hydrolase [Bacteroidales bacterium]|nr:alpha/beta hydrolase [Bacteroidales bacterium]